MLIETFLRKQLGLKAHTVTKVEETEKFLVVHIARFGGRLLRCGVCRQRWKVHSVGRPREWRDLSMRKLPLKLRYCPRRPPVHVIGIDEVSRRKGQVYGRRMRNWSGNTRPTRRSCSIGFTSSSPSE